MNEDGTFAMRAGSTAAKQPTPSLPERFVKLRKAMIEDGLLVNDGHVYQLIQDTEFRSASSVPP